MIMGMIYELKLSCNIVYTIVLHFHRCRTIVDGIRTTKCNRLDKYKPICKIAAPLTAMYILWKHFSTVKYFFTFPLLNMLKLNRFCFIIHTRVNNTVAFPNIYNRFVWSLATMKLQRLSIKNIVVYFEYQVQSCRLALNSFMHDTWMDTK